MQETTLKQNRIDYIVYGSPSKANYLLDKYGYEKVKNPKHLASALKQLARKKGITLSNELLAIHPDRKAILSLEKPQESIICSSCRSKLETKEDNYCGTCGHSNYTDGEKEELLEKVRKMDKGTLKSYLNDLIQQSNKEPTNKQLAEDTQLVWNELRLRDDEKAGKDSAPKEKSYSISIKEIGLGLGLTFLLGLVIGSRNRQVILNP